MLVGLVLGHQFVASIFPALGLAPCLILWCLPDRVRTTTSTRPPYPRPKRGQLRLRCRAKVCKYKYNLTVSVIGMVQSQSHGPTTCFPYQSLTHTLPTARVPCYFMVREQKSPWGEGPHPPSRIYFSPHFVPFLMHLHAGSVASLHGPVHDTGGG